MRPLACFAVFSRFFSLYLAFGSRVAFFHPCGVVCFGHLRACSRRVPKVREQTHSWVFVVSFACFRLWKRVSRPSALFFYCCVCALFIAFLLVLLFFLFELVFFQICALSPRCFFLCCCVFALRVDNWRQKKNKLANK
jgi:hypothetical protein